MHVFFYNSKLLFVVKLIEGSIGRHGPPLGSRTGRKECKRLLCTHATNRPMFS